MFADKILLTFTKSQNYKRSDKESKINRIAANEKTWTLLDNKLFYKAF